MEDTKLKYFGKGFNFSEDGPGNRLVYHLYGCNFHCPWCSNPECFAHDTKPSSQTTEDTVSEILRSRPMFFSGGGVTFTGGEPTLQIDAVKAVLTQIKAHGIHTAIETNASNPRLPEMFLLVDHLMMDLKHTDDAVHRRITSKTNKTVLRNITLTASCRQLALRIPLIEGYNADDRSVDGFIHFLSGLPQNDSLTVELLSYHEYGKTKWKQHGMEYTVENGFITKEKYAAISARFREAGINIIKT